MDNPKTDLEKVDAARNLVGQMMLMHKTGDSERFLECWKRANELLSQVVESLDV